MDPSVLRVRALTVVCSKRDNFKHTMLGDTVNVPVEGGIECSESLLLPFRPDETEHYFALID